MSFNTQYFTNQFEKPAIQVIDKDKGRGVDLLKRES